MTRLNPFSNEILQKIYHKFFYSLPKYYSSFFSGIEYPELNNKKILIYAAYTDIAFSPLEILNFHIYRKHGFSVDYYVYDDSIPLNEITTKKVVEGFGLNKFLKRMKKNAMVNLSSANISYNFITIDPKINQIIKNLNTIDEVLRFDYDNINFGNIVEGVMYRYYKSIKFGDDQFNIAKSFLITSLTNYFQFKKLTDQNKYEFVMFSHGIYCTWEAIAQYSKKIKLNFVCYDRAKTKNTFNFNWNQPAPNWDFSSSWNKLKNYTLNSYEKKKVFDYLKDRELQKNDVYSYNLNSRSFDLIGLKKKLGISSTSKVITLFTNLIWDAANVSRDVAFDSTVDWLKSTIDYYKNKSDIHILIRTHPAEFVLGTKEKYADIIKNLYTEFPNNLTILDESQNINSFSVIDLSDLGIVHTSTIGLEMALSAKPVILVSETHYRNKGFTYDVNSSKEYFDLIDSLSSETCLKINQVELAEKYFYLMMFEYQHSVPLVYDRKNVFNGYNYENFNSLFNDNEHHYHKVINMTINGPYDDFIMKIK